MDTSNERPTQGAHGAVGELAMESGDWRSQTQRQRIMNKILDIFKKHLPFSEYERQQELKKIAERVEEEIYTAATNQSEYSRKICFNMLAIETRLQNPMSGPSILQTDNLNGGDWQEEVYQKIKAMKRLYVIESSDWSAGLKAKARQRVVNKMYVPGSGLQQRPMANVAGQNSNLQNIQNMSNVQQNTVGNTMGNNNFANKWQIPGGQQLVPQQQPQSQQQPQAQNSRYLYQQHLQQMAKQAHIQHLQQMRSHMMHNNIGSNGLQGSSSLSSAMSPTEGTSGTVADHTMESGDWRDEVQASSRERIRIKIMNTLKRNLPLSGEQELNKIAERIEEGVYAVATSQSDYLRQLSLKILTIESGSHNEI